MSKIISSVILQAIFCSALFTLSYAQNTIIESTCQKTPLPDLCISTLKSDPRSSTANVSGLAVIAADNVFNKAVSTSDEAYALLESAKDPKTKTALNDCINWYNTIIHVDMIQAIQALLQQNPKFAVDKATTAENEIKQCEDGFGGKSTNSPMSGANKAVNDLIVILKSIASLLL